MLSIPKRYEIDHRTSKLLVGLIALTLANLTSILSETPIASISASYYGGDWPRNILVGFLFAISAFLLSYNGATRHEMVLSKIAAVAAIGVAMFPCQCGTHPEIIVGVHAISAAAMFLVLASLCWIFYRRAVAKGHREAKVRALIYGICGVAILASIAILAIDALMHGALVTRVPRLTFYCERAALFSFGISWLVASRVLPGITAPNERLHLFDGRADGDLPAT